MGGIRNKQFRKIDMGGKLNPFLRKEKNVFGPFLSCRVKIYTYPISNIIDLFGSFRVKNTAQFTLAKRETLQRNSTFRLTWMNVSKYNSSKNQLIFLLILSYPDANNNARMKIIQENNNHYPSCLLSIQNVQIICFSNQPRTVFF